MKTISLFLSILSFFLIVESCKNHAKVKPESYDYETMYKDSFNILINRRGGHLDMVDTLYTEMFIALKTSVRDSSSCGIVIDRVSKLMKMDTIKENQRCYLEAQMAVCGITKDIDKFLESQYQYINTYPHNSIERLSGLVGYFLTIHEQDSVNYYFNKVISCPEDFNDPMKRQLIVMCKLQSFILLDKDEEARDYLKEQINKEQDENSKEMISSILSDFDDFKKFIRNEIKTAM